MKRWENKRSTSRRLPPAAAPVLLRTNTVMNDVLKLFLSIIFPLATPISDRWAALRLLLLGITATTRADVTHQFCLFTKQSRLIVESGKVPKCARNFWVPCSKHHLDTRIFLTKRLCEHIKLNFKRVFIPAVSIPDRKILPGPLYWSGKSILKSS